MNKTSKNRALMQKMIDGIKIAVFLSLANNAYEVYKFVNEPDGFRRGISIALGILGTVLLYQFGRELREEKKTGLILLACRSYSRYGTLDFFGCYI
jgi:hypothetical protein